MKKEKLNRYCPICKSKEAEILHKQKFALPEGSLLSPEYDVVSCEFCGFIYADAVGSQDIYTRFYTEKSKYECAQTASGGGDSEYDALRLENTAKLIAKYMPDKTASIIDIGCGNGGLLFYLKAMGYSNLCALDPSNSCVERICQEGIEAYRGDIFEAVPENLYRRFDVLILSHVLEHIYDLNGATQNLSDFIKKDGLIYIETPDASEYINYDMVPFYFFDTEHINHFSLTYFKKLFIPLNFEFIAGGKKKMQLSPVQFYPAVYGIFSYQSNEELRSKMTEYIENSKKINQFPKIEKWAKEQTPLIVWGAGNYTLRLLEESELKNCRIVAFVDNDSKKHEDLLMGVKIIAPEKIQEIKEYLNAPILIVSALFASEITEQIKQTGLPNEIFTPA